MNSNAPTAGGVQNAAGGARDMARTPMYRDLWRMTAWVAGVFTLLVGLGLAVDHFRGKVADPLGSPRLKGLKQELQLKPKDEALKKEIRALDWELRQSYFTQIRRLNSGVYLFLAGVALFLVARGRLQARWGRLPDLRLAPGAMEHDGQWARWSVAALGGVIGVGLFWLSTGNAVVPANAAALERALAPTSGTQGGTRAAAPATPSFEELKRNWPRFLGANAGMALTTNAPVKWDVESGAGVVWKVPSPAAGFNSPIVWEDRVFMSGGPPENLEVICLDAGTGAVKWRQKVANVPGSPKEPLEIPDSTGYTAPTMATDGLRAYVIFANGDVAAFSFEGKMIWAKAFGPFHNAYGHAISLTTWQDRLILQLDQGEAEDGMSKLVALEGATGKVAWQTARKLGASWASPLVFEKDGKGQIVTLSLPWTIAYSAGDGKELWRVDFLNGEITPSPVYAGGLVFVASPSDRLVAIRPDGQGDVTKTHIVWGADESVPDVTSPASDGALVFTVTTYGMLTCFDVKDGARVWEKELEMDVHSSPAIAGGRLYIFTQNGTGLVAEAGREYKELFRTAMKDSFHASPAFTPSGNIVVRGMSNVWCLGTSPGKEASR